MGNCLLKKNIHKISKQNIKKHKQNSKKYNFKREVVNLTYYDEHGKRTNPDKIINYSYTYKGVPGGWYLK
tara:strand:- start:4090 stop:4299 length:210 start_codon:yes stop_codon:yes gene_type:complete